MHSTKRTIRWHLFFASLVIALLGGTAVAWSIYAPLDGAVVASGTIVVESNLRKVQHPTGGVVESLDVREGQQVQAGQVVLTLDDTTARAGLRIVTNELEGLSVRLSRLRAEQAGRVIFKLPEALQDRQKIEPNVARVIDSERTLFSSRLAMKQGRRLQMSERVTQLYQEIKGLEEQTHSLERQLDVLRVEFNDLDGLRAAGLTSRPRVSRLQREILQKEGALGELRAKIAQAHGRIAETRLQIIGLKRESATEVAREYRDVETRMAELRERRSAAQDQLQRVRLRAPIDGIVHQLAVHTVGGVVTPGDPVMMIVPISDELIVRARINPADIDQVSMGQSVRIRLSAFSQTTTPEVEGKVVRIGADLTSNAQSGVSYYTAGIRVTRDELMPLPSGARLVPGMPVEVFLKTGARTLASYLLKPLRDQISRSLRE